VSVIPCLQDSDRAQHIDEFVQILKEKAHTLYGHRMSEGDFNDAGILRGAIEKIRGEHAATMRDKREFVRDVLNTLSDRGAITDWQPAGGNNRHDYTVTMASGKLAVIELKGCLDGNNANIFDRPPHAEEFVIWSICESPGASPERNVWSGIHTRLSAHIVVSETNVDGLVVWDWLCGSRARPCPKLAGGDSRLSQIGRHTVPPPCIYLFPRTVPSVRTNPNPEPHRIQNVEFLAALQEVFLGVSDELHTVRIHAQNAGSDRTRTTTVSRGGAVVRESRPTVIRRGS
jgi:hypothetical protein